MKSCAIKEWHRDSEASNSAEIHSQGRLPSGKDPQP